MDREIYALKVYSTRMEYDSFQLELTPKENEEANDYYGMIFNVTVWCRGQMCAKLWGKLYDENLVYSCGMDILNAADPFGGTLRSGGEVAKYTGLFRLYPGRVCRAAVQEEGDRELSFDPFG